MKVCIIRNAQAESNASVLRIVDALTSEGNEVIVLSRNREYSELEGQVLNKEFEYKGLKIKNYEIQLSSERGKGKQNIIKLSKYMNMVYNWLKSNNEKYTHIHAFDLDTGFPGKYIAKKFKKKFVYHIADFYTDSRGGIPNQLKKVITDQEYKVINNSDLTIICTNERKQQIIGSNPKNLIVVHNTPLDILQRKDDKKLNTNNRSSNPKDNSLKISYVGGLSETRFIKEILTIVSQDSRLCLNIAGYGELSELVKEFSIKFKNINFFGQVEYSKGLEINANSDLMIAMYDPKVKNNQFSAPNKVYEAMYFGKAVIVAEGTSIDQLVLKEGIGFVSQYDSESFKEVIDSIIRDPDKLSNYSTQSQKSYNSYSWETMRERLLKGYSSI